MANDIAQVNEDSAMADHKSMNEVTQLDDLRGSAVSLTGSVVFVCSDKTYYRNLSLV
jgi:hypothetical protein